MGHPTILAREEAPPRSCSLGSVSDADETSPNDNGPESRSLSDRFLKPKKQRPLPPSQTSTVEIIPIEDRQKAMKTIEGSEVRFGWVAAILGVIFTLGLNLPNMFGPTQYTTTANPSHGHCAKDYFLVKGHCSQTLIYHPIDYVPFLIIELIMALALFVSVRMGRRTPAVFTSILMGLVVASQPPIRSFLLGVPFWIYGGWLLLRARRIQRFGTTDSRAVAEASADRRRSKKDGTTPKNPAPRRGATSKAAEGTKPSASYDTGRYTPKKPTPKKVAPPPAEPKPSRFKKLIGDEE